MLVRPTEQGRDLKYPHGVEIYRTCTREPRARPPINSTKRRRGRTVPGANFRVRIDAYLGGGLGGLTYHECNPSTNARTTRWGRGTSRRRVIGTLQRVVYARPIRAGDFLILRAA